MPLSIVQKPNIGEFVAHFLTSAKSYTRLTVTSQDETFLRCMGAAYYQAERLTRKALALQTLRLSLDNFTDPIILRKPPLIAVTDFSYLDDAGDPVSVDSALYHVDDVRTPGCIVLASGASWPTPSSSHPNAVYVEYTAGYENLDDIPEDLIHGIFMLATYLYDNRGDVNTVEKVPLPFNSRNIFRQHRINLI